jgi:vacuolar protein sorting-associated protein 54
MQAKAFLSNFHAVRLSASATLVENEVWGQVEVPPQSQRWADLLVASAMGDPPEFILTSPAQSNGSGSDSSIQGPLNEKLMQIDGRPFFVVGATLKVIEMLIDYLKVIMNLSLLTTDTMSRTIEYLKSFNSRTCQVVLGAGAMRSAGLKNITAKHLGMVHG